MYNGNYTTIGNYFKYEVKCLTNRVLNGNIWHHLNINIGINLTLNKEKKIMIK